ncbi:hypothetical protein [Benzoatithermus flavus]|uniref:Uncharacterized protein n=1 Tax=Benzoatithermus flavus TaxID=3108223 RepID=A0ABU8XYY7_9PROT
MTDVLVECERRFMNSAGGHRARMPVRQHVSAAVFMGRILEISLAVAI